MTIRVRLTLWFAAVLMGSLLAMGGLVYREMVLEPRNRAQAHEKADEPDDNPAGEVWESLAWCAGPSLILGLGGGWWLMRRALAPVARLSEAAAALNEHNLAARLPRTGNRDEVDRLTEVFNEMTARLEQSFGRIREFTLHASHELKTPLTILHNELETALQDAPPGNGGRARLESQLDEVQRLARIVDGLTLLTKADAGQVRLATEPVPLHELVQEAFADAETLARPRAIRFELEECDAAIVLGDRHRLRQLLLNLADNAIKHNHEGGWASMALKRVNDKAELTISNSGPGISPEALPQIFEPFYRGNDRQSIEGCGLGLTIARWIISAHGGTIEISSNPDKGTITRVKLPVMESRN